MLDLGQGGREPVSSPSGRSIAGPGGPGRDQHAFLPRGFGFFGSCANRIARSLSVFARRALRSASMIAVAWRWDRSRRSSINFGDVFVSFPKWRGDG